MTIIEQNALSAVASSLPVLNDIAKQLKIANQLKILEIRQRARRERDSDYVVEDMLQSIEDRL